MNDTAWKILDKLDRGVLVWGAAVAAVWKKLEAAGYVERDFGDITPKGLVAVAKWRRERE